MSPVIINAAPEFGFLTLPPPPLPKKNLGRAQHSDTAPRPRADSIAAWAASVHPGSPAPLSPCTPVYVRASPRRYNFCRPPLSPRSRRPSTSSIPTRAPFESFLNLIDTPVTSNFPPSPPPISVNQESKPDLMAFGYASVFVNLPGGKAPVAPDMYKPKPTMPVARPPSPVKSSGIFKRFKSIARSRSLPPRAKTQARSTPRPLPAVQNQVSITSAKHAKYSEAIGAEKKKRKQYVDALPPTILEEAQLRQAFEGGTLEHNIKRIMEEKAKKEAKREAKREGTHVVKGSQVVNGVDDVWRDGEGRIWLDQEEEWEFAHLLAGKPPVSARVAVEGWVPFGENSETDSSLSSRRSSSEERSREMIDVMKVDDLVDDLRLAVASRKGSIPEPPSRSAKHLHKPESVLDAYPVPTSPSYHVSSRAIKSAPGNNAGGPVRRGRNALRQRHAPPAPLQFVPPSPCLKLAINPEIEEADKREFLADSFSPPSSACKENKKLSVPTPGMKSNLAGLFKNSNERK